MRPTHAVLAATGPAGAARISRPPQIRGSWTGPDPAPPELVLLMTAVGGVTVLPAAGAAVTCVGPRRAATATAALAGTGPGAAAQRHTLWAPVLVAGLVFLGTATGFWDVAVTVPAAAPRTAARPADHAPLLCRVQSGHRCRADPGTLMTAWQTPVSVHTGGSALLIALVTPAPARDFLPKPAVPHRAGARCRRTAPHRHPGARRTVLTGLLALAYATAQEGREATGSASPSSTGTAPRPPPQPRPTTPSSRRSLWAACPDRRSSTGCPARRPACNCRRHRHRCRPVRTRTEHPDSTGRRPAAGNKRRARPPRHIERRCR